MPFTTKKTVKNPCKLCGKALRKFGCERKNGPAWAFTPKKVEYHKKCYRLGSYLEDCAQDEKEEEAKKKSI
jgi:hypothetical protein